MSVARQGKKEDRAAEAGCGSKFQGEIEASEQYFKYSGVSAKPDTGPQRSEGHPAEGFSPTATSAQKFEPHPFQPPNPLKETTLHVTPSHSPTLPNRFAIAADPIGCPLF